MKNLLKLFSSTILLFILSLFVGNQFLSVTPVSAGIVTLATVNTGNIEIVSQKDNTFQISFDISNREGIQTGVKYGVFLTKETENGIAVIDEKIYDESLTLVSGNVVSREVTYTAPDTLSGEYTLMFKASNSNGFTFGIRDIGKVTLSAISSGLQILPETCYLNVEGEENNTKYSIYKGVDIKQEENLILTCDTLNSSQKNISVKPSYETHYRSTYGDIVDQTGGDNNPITFDAMESKSFSVVLPKATTPQKYDIVFKLGKSNPVTISYTLWGSSATVQSVFLDKDYYIVGDTANVSLVYTSSGNSVRDSRFKSENIGNITANLSILSDNGEYCSENKSQTLQQNLLKADVPISIIKECSNPKIIISLTDDNGTVLDQKEFIVKTTSTPTPSKSNSMYFIIILVLVIIIIIYSIAKRNKNTPATPVGIFLLFLLVALFGFIPSHKVSADMIALSISDWPLATYYVVDLVVDNQSDLGSSSLQSLTPGETINLYGRIYNTSTYGGSPTSQAEGYITAILQGWDTDPTLFNKYTSQSIDPSDVYDSEPNIDGGPYLIAPNVAGSYDIDFVFAVAWTDEYVYFNHTIPITVVSNPTVTVFANGSSSNQTVTSGSSVTIKWTSQNATSCTCTYTGGGSCGTGVGDNVPLNPTPIVVTSNRTFTVTCTN
jgi:hypothetical protein